MSLPTNRMPGDMIQAADINQIAEAVNASGSLIPLTGNTTIPAGTKQGELIGYRNFGTTTHTVNGESVPPGEYVIFTWTGTMWIRINTPAGPPDTEPPTAPTNLQATPDANGVTLTWTAATDNRGIGGYEARLQRSGTTTWTTWTALASGGSLGGLIPTTGYTAQVRALDFAANPGPSAEVTFTTTAVPLTGDITDTFTAPDNTPVVGRTTTTGGKTWVAAEGTGENGIIGLASPNSTTAVIQNGKFVSSSGGSTAQLAVDPGPVKVEVDYALWVNSIRIAIGGNSSEKIILQIVKDGTVSFLAGGSGSASGQPLQGRVALIWDGTNVRVEINGSTVIGPAPSTLAATGKVAFSLPSISDHRVCHLDNLAVTYL